MCLIASLVDPRSKKFAFTNDVMFKTAYRAVVKRMQKELELAQVEPSPFQVPAAAATAGSTTAQLSDLWGVL